MSITEYADLIHAEEVYVRKTHELIAHYKTLSFCFKSALIFLSHIIPLKILFLFK